MTPSPSPLRGSLLHFDSPRGPNVQARVQAFTDWIGARRDVGVWPYARVLLGQTGDRAVIADEYAHDAKECLNYASQDYLGLASDARIRDAAHAAIDRCGVHSAGSPALAGRTEAGLALEERIASLYGMQSAMLFPTGWAAGFCSVAALARKRDTILIDALGHNCLQEGARHATEDVIRFRHNDLEAIRSALVEARERNPDNAVFIVTESLFSMDSDSPRLREIAMLAREHGAFLIVDVAHDFGSMGARGLGALEECLPDLVPDLVMGSFSKTFATNGGFAVTSREIREQLRYYGSAHTFSNAISPIQIGVATACFDVVFGEEGAVRRQALLAGIAAIRDAMVAKGFEVIGKPSPIVPVYVGAEDVARLTSREMIRMGLQANLVEFPAVPKGLARFRFQVMSNHGVEPAQRAARILAEARELARAELARTAT